MVIIVINAGKASDTSSKLIFFTESTISTPTITKAPLVAAEGISKNTGDMNIERTKKMPTNKEVSPERPPSAMPDALST